MHHFEFSSSLPAEYLEDLEALMFFNPLQQMAGTGVVNSIERFGTPEITVRNDELSVTLGQNDVQPLFALAEADEGHELAGMALYLRTDSSNIIVLHLAVTERFSSVGSNADALLLMRMLQAVFDSARRLEGVRYMTIMYSQRARVVRIGQKGALPGDSLSPGPGGPPLFQAAGSDSSR